MQQGLGLGLGLELMGRAAQSTENGPNPEGTPASGFQAHGRPRVQNRMYVLARPASVPLTTISTYPAFTDKGGMPHIVILTSWF